jgi:hypothetical protein
MLGIRWRYEALGAVVSSGRVVWSSIVSVESQGPLVRPYGMNAWGDVAAIGLTWYWVYSVSDNKRTSGVGEPNSDSCYIEMLNGHRRGLVNWILDNRNC